MTTSFASSVISPRGEWPQFRSYTFAAGSSISTEYTHSPPNAESAAANPPMPANRSMYLNDAGLTVDILDPILLACQLERTCARRRAVRLLPCTVLPAYPTAHHP